MCPQGVWSAEPRPQSQYRGRRAGARTNIRTGTEIGAAAAARSKGPIRVVMELPQLAAVCEAQREEVTLIRWQTLIILGA